MQTKALSMSPPKPTSEWPARAGANAADLALVRRILEGDEQAWQTFVERYAGLIHAVSRRYLHSRDPDDRRTVFVDVLSSLRRSKLRTYEGRAALSTWLTLVARTEVMDYLRRNFGRALRSKALDRLAPHEQVLFRLYYIEGRPIGEVVTMLGAAGDPWTTDRFVAALQHIERRLGERWLRRLSYDLHAQSVGASSGRLLEYLDHVRDEYQQRSGALSPDYHLMEREARRTAQRLEEMVAALEPRERAVLELRFERGWSARQIAEELGLDRSRSAYTLLDRIIRGLRRRLSAAKEEEA